jgi:hypothetical protein
MQQKVRALYTNESAANLMSVAQEFFLRNAQESLAAYQIYANKKQLRTSTLVICLQFP